MKYYIQRQLNEYGPYTLADLQRYVAQGSIQLADLTRSEGMTDWVPVSQVIGNIPIPVAAGATAGAYAGGTAYGGSGTVYDGSTTGFGVQPVPMQGSPFIPPDFHWGLVLLIGIFTCGLFFSAWMIVEAAFVRKIKPDSKGLMFVIIAVAGSYLGGFANGFFSAINHTNPQPLGHLITIIFALVYLVGAFQMRSDLEEYYNETEPINLQLGGVMTFFFAIFYFQHHFSRIAQWKKTGILTPQG
jgi:GYF domain 2